jgi:hypothetical protein
MNIGNHQPNTWQGAWPSPHLRVSEIPDAGIRGKMRLISEWDSENAIIRTYKTIGSQTGAEQEKNDILAMQGHEWQITDQFGIDRGTCLIVRAYVEYHQIIGGGYELETTFEIAPAIVIPTGWTL